ncbi:RusA family crossover junction endodeoxyribonuclease [Microbacterium ginsengisoli]|nr:RusA family crossover junction endodeoxyribonuclease [Microbacteriaceae bacterium K1510]
MTKSTTAGELVTPDLEFAVSSTPAPQGSKDFKGMRNGHAVLVESSARVKPWRQDVVLAARLAIKDHAGWRPLDGAVLLTIEFFMPRPSGAPKSRRTLPNKMPDLSKLIRSTEDAMTTAGVWRDDAIVTDVIVRKRYAAVSDDVALPWEPPGLGAVVAVFTVPTEATWSDIPLTLTAGRILGRGRPRLPEVIEAAAVWFDRAQDAYSAATGEVISIAGNVTNSRANALLARASVIARAGKVPVTVVVERASERLQSVSGQPLNALQLATMEVLSSHESTRSLYLCD